ncbi:MAG: 4-(cytidine 5'-diphospho)-2-C-methyl-D-erythritol kinase [Lentisphaeria bacterium]
MKTPAKVNFYLEVTGIQPNGYHTIRTLFLPLKNLVDTVDIETKNHPGITMDCNKPESELSAGPENLCIRAASSFSTHFNISPCWHIHLQKAIPLTAGLGGGSSDAAAVFRILAKRYHLEEHPDLPVIAAKLGADIPFFLQDKPAVGTGIGDILTPLSPAVAPLDLLVINPLFPLPVQWVYKHAYRPGTPAIPDFNQLLKIWGTATPRALASFMWNDLEACVFDKFPILPIIKQRLLDFGALNVLLSGSGPTLFALCDHNSQELAQKLAAEFGNSIKLFCCQA